MQSYDEYFLNIDVSYFAFDVTAHTFFIKCKRAHWINYQSRNV